VDFTTRLERLIGPLPGLKEARAISIFTLAAGAVMCALSLYYGYRGQTFMGRPLGSDFVQFYAAGKILNSGHGASWIYHIETIVSVEHESLPAMDQSQMLLFGYAPYIATLFRPLALLPYFWAYCVWLAISLALYTASLAMLFRGSIPFLLALSSPMFVFETWIGGQISVIAFVAVALFIANFRRGRFFLAGLSLAIAAYKPSLIAIPVLMLIIGRCWRVVAGAAAGTAASAALALMAGGVEACRQWFSTVHMFAQLATAADVSIRHIKYVDLNSFFLMLFGANVFSRACTFAAVGILLAWLARAWWKSRAEDRETLIAATLVIMLAANVYVPVYDTIILAAAAALAAHSLRGNKSFQLWIVSLYLAAFLTQSFAEFARVQIFTPLVVGFGVWVLQQPRMNADKRESVCADPGAPLFL